MQQDMAYIPKSLSVKLRIPNRVQPEVNPAPGHIGQYTNKLHYFKKHLLDEVCKKKFAIDFMEPVDTEILQVPTYYTIIDRPMDLGTITKRVQNNYYSSVDEAISDFRLVLRNCFIFNRPGDVVHRKGKMLEKFFLKKIKGLPKGVEILCKKDPKAVTKTRAIGPKTTISLVHIERQCREQLKKLQNFTNQADTNARNFFSTKWDSLIKKVDKHYFKTVEEFRHHVDSIFKRYHDPARIIYERAFGLPSQHCPPGFTIGSGGGNQMIAQDIYELLEAAKQAENGLQTQNDNTKSKEIIDNFRMAISKVKQRLDTTCNSLSLQQTTEQTWLGASNPSQNPEELVKFEVNEAHMLIGPHDVQSLLTVDLPYSSDEDGSQLPLTGASNEHERRAIQKLFAKLPAAAMRDIVHLVQQTEGLSTDNRQVLSFDVKNFGADTVFLMKRAVVKAMRAQSKLNLRDMPPAEKEGLQRSLESQLDNITRMLNSSRRRGSCFTAKAMATSRKRTNTPGRPQGHRGSTGLPKNICQRLSETSEDEENNNNNNHNNNRPTTSGSKNQLKRPAIKGSPRQKHKRPCDDQRKTNINNNNNQNQNPNQNPNQNGNKSSSSSSSSSSSDSSNSSSSSGSSSSSSSSSSSDSSSEE